MRQGYNKIQIRGRIAVHFQDQSYSRLLKKSHMISGLVFARSTCETLKLSGSRLCGLWRPNYTNSIHQQKYSIIELKLYCPQWRGIGYS